MPIAPEPRRGEIWLARLDKLRPVVVLTRDPMGHYLRSVLAAPITSSIRGLSTEVELGAEDGLRRVSVANLDNTQLVERDDLIERVGKARPSTMERICYALSVVVDCDKA